MKRIKAVFLIFSFFFIISLLILFFFQTPLNIIFQTITLPIQKWVFISSSKSDAMFTSQQQLQKENNQLRVQLAQMQEIKKDNQALHDQFQTSTPIPQKLLPAEVIGVQQNTLLIDKGEQDKVHRGDIAVFKNNLIGKIAKTTPHISVVVLLSDSSTSFTAETAKTATVGIVTVQDETSIFDNVVLSDKLEKNDVIMTKGDQDLQGHGYPPNLIVGKIVSVDKQASNLFQAAKIQSLVDVADLRMVFVMTQ
ncbi:MAG TPA: rod shape-determining protein MreC [Candidatus Sulfotelmatobacter sp.]|nr:rod shape-determining protein MreC [Candidatus Sulfotelmatobacter sp.]